MPFGISVAIKGQKEKANKEVLFGLIHNHCGIT